jgi:cyclopropane fatty-acyl-phospholipid synthase-like methyltransferase
MTQARMMRPWTTRFFRAAGLTEGMSVLDAGSGLGDVALLVADIVGSGGRVLGVERDGATTEKARRRAASEGCSGLAKAGIDLPAGVTFDETLAERLETAVLEHGSQILGPVQYGAWIRVPDRSLPR